MRIHRLEITALGPYAGTETIEFDGLNEAGVMLLSGPTGSGKTTILDAVCFAIYGEIPRAAKGSEVVSHHRDFGTPPKVVLDFTVAGSRLRVTRSPEYQRPKKHDKTELTPEAQSVQLERFQDDGWTGDSAGWTESNKRLAALVGMNADQFHQLVLLPQGKFARFLEAGVKDRKELLETLFPGNDLTYVEDWLKKRSKEDSEARNQKLQEISNQLEQARPTFTELVREMEVEEAEALPELPDYSESGPVIEWTAVVSAELDARCESSEMKKARSQEAWASADSTLTAAKTKRDQIRQRAEAEKKVKELEAKAGWREKLASRNAAAERAATVVPLIRQATGQKEAAEAQTAKSEELAAALRSPDSAGTDDESDLRGLKADAGKHAAAIEHFEKEGLPRRRELEKKVEATAEKLAELEEGGPQSELAGLKAALDEAEETRKTARLDLVETRQRRTAGMAAELAAGLEPETACPVCGSVKHPGMDHSDSPPVSEELEAEAAKRDSQSEAALISATRSYEDAVTESRRQVDALKTETAHLETELKGLVRKEGELAAGEASPAARREKLEALVELIESFFTSVRQAADAIRSAEEVARSAAREAADRGFEDLDSAEAAWVAPEDLTAAKAEVESHDMALNQAKGLLGGDLRDVDPKEKVDLKPLEEAAAKAAGVRDADLKLLSVAAGRQSTFAGVTAGIPRLFEELAPLREAAALSANLTRLASGDNERRMKLSTYVLAVRLRQVIQAANRHLRRMSNDRYELAYSGDVAAHGATSGLGIRVFDFHTSETRSTGTFSGGEAFYASLSLALGLAEVVQNESGGKPLETLFIDEGFGTLDSKTLDQVMDVIDDLRAGGRTVGLVSHVEELRNRVTARIEVTATPSGSTLDVVGV